MAGLAVSGAAAQIETHALAAPESRGRFYLPQLDVLRFFAFFAVFISHALLPLHRALPIPDISRTLILNAADLGVDLFFVLSAYLITSLLLRERRITGKLDVKSFYMRRILRIWPLYFFFLTAAFAIYLWASLEFPLRPMGIYFGALFLFVGNFVYCAKGVPGRLLGPLWSVCVEEQFYMLWPLAIRRAQPRRLATIAVALIAVGELTRLASARHGLGGDAIWCNTFARLDPIAVGILLALLPHDRLAGLHPVWRGAALMAGAGCWLLAGQLRDVTAPAMSMLEAGIGYPVGTLGSAAFLVASLGAVRLARPTVLNRALIYLGRISYGLYIYHALAVIAAQSVVLGGLQPAVARGWPPWLAWIPYLAASLVLSVAVSAASYRWLESPFLRLKRRFTHVPSRPV